MKPIVVTDRRGSSKQLCKTAKVIQPRKVGFAQAPTRVVEPVVVVTKD